MRKLREDYDDWEVIASFRSKPFCVGSVEDVEEDLIDLMNSNETAFRQIVNYLRDVGYPVNSDDFDADDYADWFARELYEEFRSENEDELEFGYFNFKMKVFHNYNESIRRSNESMVFESAGKKCYIVVNLEKAREPKIIGVFLNKQHAEKAAYEVPNQWRNIIETTIQQ